MKSREEPEGQEENEGEKRGEGGEGGEGEEHEEEEEEEEIGPAESSSKFLKKGEARSLILLYLGCIYERKLSWVRNTLE